MQKDQTIRRRTTRGVTGKASAPRATDDRKTKLRYGGTCRVCGDKLDAGTWAMYCPADSSVAHDYCAAGVKTQSATQAERVSRREEARRRIEARKQQNMD